MFMAVLSTAGGKTRSVPAVFSWQQLCAALPAPARVTQVSAAHLSQRTLQLYAPHFLDARTVVLLHSMGCGECAWAAHQSNFSA
jgi:hypothetical protein